MGLKQQGYIRKNNTQMIKCILSFTFLILNSNITQSEESKGKRLEIESNYSTYKKEKLSINNLNNNLLNSIVLQLVNVKRRKKGLDTLTQTSALNKVSLKFQDKLELRRFSNSSSIERKINRTLYYKTKSAGFDGGLVIPVVGEFEALDYDGKSEFFYDKEDKETEFKLFYGKKPRKSELNPFRKEIKALDYYSFAKKILKKLESENKKQLYSKSFKWGGLHLQWYYKTLNKRKIPQIKMIFILGGYATIGMR
tara:strand:- start:975 stop:1733 length:759 start_codon:yes stop_codon:yes gene_type:complete